MVNARQQILTEDRFVVLTFDDGPTRLLEPILDILLSEQIPAMFFWQTRLLHYKRPWRRVIEEGHVIGTHTITHPNLQKLSLLEQRRELMRSKELIETYTGQTVRYFRPPFGQYNDQTLDIADELGLKTIMWDVASFDWILKAEPERIIQHVIEQIEDGSIILLHELKQTLIVLPMLIKQLKDKGYEFKILPT
ncbi:polysaccharide deacetylase family protein [Bacillus sp. FJAT-45037]|uniref:polysaccharide deacetylase family protein n=1 Tax=Bacillus sp. FJAT-45037 TaxID=2011007 RepID=UPI000C250A6A|nr:polysaccharide deacetylase family protein [Bacillus sp. FJAT-45037]